MSQSQSQQQTISLTGIVDQTQFDKRLDQVLADLFPEYSRSKLKEWILAGFVKVDDEVVTVARQKMQGDEQIDIHAVIAVQVLNTPQNIELDIVFEDEHVLVINKPAGLVVHPGAGNADGTVLNALLAHHPEIENIPRAGIVHRLDKDTTGLMVVAKTLIAQTYLVEQLQTRVMSREYEALVMGTMVAGGFVDEPIGRHPTKRTSMAVRATGKEATTHYRIKEKFRAHTHLRLKLESGRTHQIRVHMAHIRFPIVGDDTYAGRFRIHAGARPELRDAIQNFARQALHARELGLIHPASGELVSWSSELPGDMQSLIKVLDHD